MAVTVSWVEWVSAETPGFGSGDTQHDNFQLASNHTITAATNINLGNTSARDLTPASYPIAAGSNSYTKYFALQFSGSYTQISNAKIWKSAGNYVNNEIMQFSGNVAFATPVTTDAGDPTIPTSSPADNAPIGAVGLDFHNRNGSSAPSAPATTRTIPHADDTASSPGYYSGSRSSIIRFQLTTQADTPAGPVNQKTISLTYDRQ